MTGVGYESYVENFKKAETKEFDPRYIRPNERKNPVTNIENRITDLLPQFKKYTMKKLTTLTHLRKRVQAKLNDPVELHRSDINKIMVVIL